MSVNKRSESTEKNISVYFWNKKKTKNLRRVNGTRRSHGISFCIDDRDMTSSMIFERTE